MYKEIKKIDLGESYGPETEISPNCALYLRMAHKVLVESSVNPVFAAKVARNHTRISN